MGNYDLAGHYLNRIEPVPRPYYRNQADQQERVWVSYFDNSSEEGGDILYVEIDASGSVWYLEHDVKTAASGFTGVPAIPDPTVMVVRQGTISHDLTQRVFQATKDFQNFQGDGSHLISGNQLTMHWYHEGRTKANSSSNLIGYDEVPSAIRELHQQIINNQTDFPVQSNIFATITATETTKSWADRASTPFVFADGHQEPYPRLRMTEKEAMNFSAFEMTLGHAGREYFVQSTGERDALEALINPSHAGLKSQPTSYPNTSILLELSDKKKYFLVFLKDVKQQCSPDYFTIGQTSPTRTTIQGYDDRQWVIDQEQHQLLDAAGQAVTTVEVGREANKYERLTVATDKTNIMLRHINYPEPLYGREEWGCSMSWNQQW